MQLQSSPYGFGAWSVEENGMTGNWIDTETRLKSGEKIFQEEKTGEYAIERDLIYLTNPIKKELAN